MKETKTIKICMLTYSFPPEHSGAALQAIRLANKLAGKGVEIFFISQCSQSGNLTKENTTGFNVKKIYKGTFIYKIVAPIHFFLALFIAKKNIDIIHVHGVGYIAKIAVIFGWIFGIKVIIKMTLLEEDDPLSIQRRKFGQFHFWLFSRATHYIAMSSGFYESCSKTNILASKVSIIPNGVDTEKFKQVSDRQKFQIRKKLKLPVNRTVLVYAGFFRKIKGIDFLLDVIDTIKISCPDTFLLILGPVEDWFFDQEKTYINEVLKRIDALSAENILRYPGKVDNVSEFFQASDIFVSASHREGIPNVLLEAMACGLPPVVVSIPGVYDTILSDGIDGIIVKERDIEKFSAKVIGLMEDKALYMNISTATREKVVHGFSLDTVSERYMKLYRELI